jgi:hypothetical protein
VKFLHEYINEFRASGEPNRLELAEILEKFRNKYHVLHDGKPRECFEKFVQQCNWLGDPNNKTRYAITQNLARHLFGALMQDFSLHLVMQVCSSYPKLDVFTEVRVPFGRYPLWEGGEITIEIPAEKSDLAIGYLIEEKKPKFNPVWPKEPFYRLEKNQTIYPLVMINSRIKVSQSEFFEWLGRDQLMTKGNPHCLSVQVALRKEMDMSIVEAAQCKDKFFLLGEGGKRSIVPKGRELNRFIHVLTEHLENRMVITK